MERIQEKQWKLFLKENGNLDIILKIKEAVGKYIYYAIFLYYIFIYINTYTERENEEIYISLYASNIDRWRERYRHRDGEIDKKNANTWFAAILK